MVPFSFLAEMGKGVIVGSMVALVIVTPLSTNPRDYSAIPTPPDISTDAQLPIVEYGWAR